MIKLKMRWVGLIIIPLILTGCMNSSVECVTSSNLCPAEISLWVDKSGVEYKVRRVFQPLGIKCFVDDVPEICGMVGWFTSEVRGKLTLTKARYAHIKCED